MKTLSLLLGIGLLTLSFTACQPSNISSSSSKYNLHKDDHDPSDQTFAPSKKAEDLAPSIDLRQGSGAFPPVFDQGNINSCSANAVSAAIYYDMVKQNWRSPFVPSRLFIYYNERKLAGTLDEKKYGQIGAPVSLRDCITSVHEQGYCKERMWPYDTEKLYIEPPAAAFDTAKMHHTYTYQRIDSKLADLKACIAEGFPFMFGIDVYESFESDAVSKSGMVPMPAATEKQIGGHAVLAIGYDEEKRQFIFRNSFGSGWGKDGYGYMPYDFVLKYGFDFWVLNKVI